MLIDPLPLGSLDPQLQPLAQKSTLANMVAHGLGRRPVTLLKWFEFYHELTRVGGSVSMGYKELIRHQIASLYQCRLCTSFIQPTEELHDVDLVKAGKVLDPDDTFTPAEKALLDFTRRVYEGPDHLDAAAFARLREFFTEEQITEIGFIAAMFTGWGRLTFGFQVVDSAAVKTYEVAGSFDQCTAHLD